MNDLAEKALHGADVVRRAVAARPLPGLALLGFVLAAVVVLTGGRIGADPAVVPINRWLGLLPSAEYRVEGVVMGTVMFSAIVALLLLWLLTIRVSRVHRFRPRQVWTLAAVWGVPFAVGPPLLSTDVFGYVARGLLARAGLDPYRTGPSTLGEVRVVAAIDPAWRSARSTEGPLTTLVSHGAVAVSGGQAVVALIVLRLVALASVIAIGVLAADLAGGRRSAALCLTVLNPAVLLHVVSAAHLTGLLVALLLGALRAAGQRRWLLAVVLVCLAAGVKPVALVALPAVVAANALGHSPRSVVRIVARDAALAAVVLAAAVLTVPDGLGWMRNVTEAIHAHIPFTPSSIVGKVLGWIVSPATFDDLDTGARIAAVAAAATVLVYLWATVVARPLDRTVGYGLVTAALLAPVLYPWFLLWGVLVLAATALGARRDWVIALSCVACVLNPVGLGSPAAVYVTTVALCAVGLVLVVRLLVRTRWVAVSDLR